jgi:protein ImuB
MLRELGIDTIGGVLRLSAKSLASRFPPLLSRRLAEFSGTLAEPLVGPRGDDLPQACRTFDSPVAAADASEDALVAVVEELLASCLVPLAASGRGVLALQVRLEHAGAGGGVGHAPAVIDVGLFQPSGSVRHLAELVRLRLGRMRSPSSIDGIAVEVVAAGSVTCRQRLLFAASGGADDANQGAEADLETGLLLDRLSGRLGRAAVFMPRAVGDPQPEHAWIAAPPTAAASGNTPARRGTPGNARNRHDDALPQQTPAGRRPIWMAPRPLRLTAGAGLVAVAPDGPPVQFRLGDRLHRIVKARGPERIETAWWRGPTVRRDYYVVETESGARFWLFRRLREGGWFLHGAFA